MVLPDLENFADDNTIDACCTNIEDTIKNLEDNLLIALNWFRDNGMVANPQKFQVMFLGLKTDQSFCLSVPVSAATDIKGIKFLNDRSIKIGGRIIVKSIKSVKLLGVIIDDKLTFNAYI